MGRHGDRITCLTSSSDGRYVLALGIDDRWTLWDAVSKKLVREWQGNAFIETGRVIGTTETDLLITQVLFLADREALVVASSWSDWEDQQIVKVALATGRYSSVLRFSGHSIAATYVDREGALYCGLNRSVTKIDVNWTANP